MTRPTVPDDGRAEVPLAYTPRQLFAGFALVAALIAILLRGLRSRPNPHRDDPGPGAG